MKNIETGVRRQIKVLVTDKMLNFAFHC